MGRPVARRRYKITRARGNANCELPPRGIGTIREVDFEAANFFLANLPNESAAESLS